LRFRRRSAEVPVQLPWIIGSVKVLKEVMVMISLRTLYSKRAMRVLVSCGLVGLLLFAFFPQEPVYAGKRLNFWLDRLPATTGCSNGELVKRLPAVRAYCYEEAVAGHERLLVTSETAERAVYFFGPRCLPALAARLRCQDTRFTGLREKIWQVAMKHGLWRGCHVLHEAVIERGQAITAISQLGEITARPLLPDLVRIARRDPDPGLRASALEVLRRLGWQGD
jgi:hypothetical protein